MSSAICFNLDQSKILLSGSGLTPAFCTFGSYCNFNPFPNKPWFFMCLQYKSFENTEGKGEIAHNEQFLLFPQCFLPIWRTFCYFHQI